MKTEKIFVCICAIALISIGLRYIFLPEFGMSHGVVSVDANGRVDIQATYGGVQLGIGLALLMLVLKRQPRAASIVLCLVLGSVGVVRLLAGLLSDGADISHAAALFELALVAALLAVMRWSPAGNNSQ